MGTLSLALGNGLKAGANCLGHITRIEQANGDDYLNQFVKDNAFGHEQWKHRGRHKQHGNQRHRAEQLDKRGAEHPNDRQLRTPAKGKNYPTRQGRGNTDTRYDEGEKQPAPFGPGNSFNAPRSFAT